MHESGGGRDQEKTTKEARADADTATTFALNDNKDKMVTKTIRDVSADVTSVDVLSVSSSGYRALCRLLMVCSHHYECRASLDWPTMVSI